MRKSCEAPAHLSPADLSPVRAIVGDGALDYALVVVTFHFINRMADLLHVDSEGLPEGFRRFEWIRRIGVRIASRLMARMDLRNRRYGTPYAEAVARVAPIFRRATGHEPGAAFAPVSARPKLVEVVQLALEEREKRTSIARATVARIQRVVDEALPRAASDTQGFHARPADPVEAFAFVGTRYAPRTTAEMIGRLRGAGYDDVGILDLATAVADANSWARLHRLTGLAPGILTLPPGGIESGAPR